MMQPLKVKIKEPQNKIGDDCFISFDLVHGTGMYPINMTFPDPSQLHQPAGLLWYLPHDLPKTVVIVASIRHPYNLGEWKHVFLTNQIPEMLPLIGIFLYYVLYLENERINGHSQKQLTLSVEPRFSLPQALLGRCHHAKGLWCGGIHHPSANTWQKWQPRSTTGGESNSIACGAVEIRPTRKWVSAEWSVSFQASSWKRMKALCVCLSWRTECALNAPTKINGFWKERGRNARIPKHGFIWMSQIMLSCERQYSCMLLTVQCNVSISIYIYICIYIYSTFTQSTSGLRLFGSFIKNPDTQMWMVSIRWFGGNSSPKSQKLPKLGFEHLLPSFQSWFIGRGQLQTS